MGGWGGVGWGWVGGGGVGCVGGVGGGGGGEGGGGVTRARRGMRASAHRQAPLRRATQGGGACAAAAAAPTTSTPPPRPVPALHSAPHVPPPRRAIRVASTIMCQLLPLVLPCPATHTPAPRCPPAPLPPHPHPHSHFHPHPLVLQIMEHPWFQADLPQGATSMNDFYFRNAPTVDHAAPQIAKILEHAAKTGSPGA